MCGIVGFFGDYQDNVFLAFETMLKLDTIRGEDSTGVIAVMKDYEVKHAKHVLIPWVLFAQESYQDIRNDKRKPVALIGHNRAATKGSVNNENAHPFRHEHISLVHNGTVWNEKELTKDFQLEFDTDSEAICASIAHNGIEETWKKLQGAATLVWWDEEERSLNFITNKKRPFWYGVSFSETKIVFSSERWMFEQACERHKLFIDKKLEPNSDWLLTFTYDDKTKKIKSKSRKLEAFSFNNNKYKTYANFGNKLWNQHFINNNKKIDTNQEHLYDENGLHLGYGNQLDLRNNENMTEKEFNEIYKQCYTCSGGLEGQFQTSIILDDQYAMCSDCVRDCQDSGIDLNHVGLRGM